MSVPFKTHALLGSNYLLDGKNVINRNHQRIAEIINDFDHELTLSWIPTDKRQPTDVKPFAIVHQPLGGESKVVMYLREDQIDERLIGVLVKARHDGDHNPLTAIEAYEQAQALVKAKREEDEAEEAKDLARSILKSNLHVYKHGGKKYR